MNKTLTRIILTESALAVALTTITLASAGSSTELMRATAAGLVGLRLLVGLLRVIAKNICYLRKSKNLNPAHA